MNEVDELGDVTAWGALARMAEQNKLTISVNHMPTGYVYVTVSSAVTPEPEPRMAMSAENAERAAELLLERIWKIAWENTGEDGLELDPRRGERTLVS